MLKDIPIRLPTRENLLVQPKANIYHPDQKIFNLTAWHLSTENKKKETRKLLSASWRKGTQIDYNCKLRKFSSWCDKWNKDPYSVYLENFRQNRI